MQPNKSVEEIEKAYPEAYRLARKFHTLYEETAPKFGYETRGDTKEFEPKSPNGRTMAYVCKMIVDEEVKKTLSSALTEQLEELERWVTDKQKIYVDELKKENGVVLIKKLYTDEEKRADSQGSYLSLDDTLSYIREQKEIIKKQ